MWRKISVEQYQQIQKINASPLEDMDKTIQIIMVLFDLSEQGVDELPVKKFQDLTLQLAQTFSAPLKQAIPKKSIRAGKTKYRLQYEARKITYGQWTDVHHFSEGNIIENLHHLAAIIAKPAGLFKSKASHEKIAEDFLHANFMDTYNAVVFFCLTSCALEKDINLFSVKPSKILQKLKRELQSATVQQDLPIGTDGYIQQPSLETMKLSG